MIDYISLNEENIPKVSTKTGISEQVLIQVLKENAKWNIFTVAVPYERKAAP